MNQLNKNIELAEKHCQEKGERLTQKRKLVLLALLDSQKAISAYELVEYCKQDLARPFDVYDDAAWLAVTPLSEVSISLGSHPVAFPDFTRGRWTERKNDFAYRQDY